MILLDTTVLVYAVGADHPLQRPCRRLLKAIADHAVEATTTPEVIQEFVHVRSRRRSRADAVRLGTEWIHLLSPLSVVNETVLAAGLRLYDRVDDLGSFDAVLAAAAQQLGAPLASADRRFAAVTDLQHVVPDDDGIDRLLGEA
ncbi:MAG: type II toxin-antitoxin system VapC family toxin [Nocardioidaceae bacterium]